MRNDDTRLIQCVLEGDDAAFAELVKKYQQPVHALVWRKVGDFHVAEEITQDHLPESIPETDDAKRARSVLRVGFM